MPNYTKFMKEVLSKKVRIEEDTPVTLTATCSALLQSNLPRKMKDPGSYTTPCIIGNSTFHKALCDLGAKDVLVKVYKFILCVDFVVLERPEDDEAPIILGHPFLATGKVMIDMDLGSLKLRVNGDESAEILGIDEVGIIHEIPVSVKTNPVLELKQLPDYLCYAFLGADKTYPVIISSSLSEAVTKTLLEILREYRSTIGCSIEDIKGISPSTVQHKILMEDVYKPRVQPQRRLNLSMNEVLNKEVLKLLGAGMIYAISDSAWVSPPLEKTMSPFPFIDQMLDMLGGFEYYCFLDGYSGYNQISIAPEDQKKTTFTCPYDTFAFRRMPFGLCNAPATFKRCMMSIFHDGHKVSKKGLEVDRAKIETIEKLCPPKDVKGAFTFLKEKLTHSPTMITPDWEEPFEIMCDAIDYAAHKNYSTTEKVMLAVVYDIEKFRPYIFGSQVIIYTDHAAIRYLFAKNDAKPRLIRWVLLLQEFDLEIRDKKGSENVMVDHLSRLILDEAPSEGNIQESFPDEQLLAISTHIPWYADVANFLASGIIPDGLSYHRKKKFLHNSRFFLWDEPLLFRTGPDRVIQRCVPEAEIHKILTYCHSSPCDGHHRESHTAAKVLQSGFFWATLFRDSYEFVKWCVRCQRTGNLSKKSQMPLKNMREVELFDVWGIDFMGPFPHSNGKLYIMLAVDYVSKWVEAISTTANDARTVLRFFHKNIFSRFGTPRASISDEGSHFCNKLLAILTNNLGIRHKIALAYHPQTNGLAELSNREIKQILEKTVSTNRKDWALKLDDVL
ncbi:PREDICTED: uncharacterized protein LOC105954889 [Erythranthe guttata]|uniref:uncharacterized protein LOC105954889 n=1 Tax=Erythranthe guttata TaxID=4155 RepID=UPI00064DA695|nr:PREDICTED: uncharacterized protein LOC105954889 [Erythranthe guttata]|eukprot:XP_012834026.1 PREDICTED: uncharacterized protein LOC105954889 [Erythranthe guttata]